MERPPQAAKFAIQPDPPIAVKLLDRSDIGLKQASLMNQQEAILGATWTIDVNENHHRVQLTIRCSIKAVQDESQRS